MSSAPLLVGVHHVDADAAATDPGEQRAQRGRGAHAATHLLAEVVGMHMHLHRAPTPTGHHVDPDIVGIVDDPADQMLDSVDHDRAHAGQPSVGASAAGCSAASAAGSSAALVSVAASGDSSATALAAFLAGAFFFGLAASVVGAPSASASAALNSSSLVGLAGADFRRPSAPGIPLNFCQSPVIFNSLRTGSVGWAPTESQYWARSELISIRLGSSLG